MIYLRSKSDNLGIMFILIKVLFIRILVAGIEHYPPDENTPRFRETWMLEAL